jgi:hypothetical protein
MQDLAPETGWTRIAIAGVVIVCVGLGFAMLRRAPRPEPLPPVGERTTPMPPPPLPPAAPPSVPAGEIAWISDARGPLLLARGGDEAEDIFGFFRVWDGRSAWTTHAGAFHGSTLELAWQTEALDPWLIRKSGVVPVAIALGKRVVVADGTDQLRVYKRSGEKEATFRVAVAPRDLCGLPDGTKVWIDADPPAMLDVDAGTVVSNAAEPAACKKPARSSRISPDQVPWGAPPNPRVPAIEGVDVARAVTDGTAQIALGATATKNADGGRSIPTAIAYAPGGKVLWQRAVAADPSTLATESAPRVAELAGGRLYVVYGKEYFDARLEALDAKTGQTAWDVPLVGSLPRHDAFGSRGDAVSVVVSESRVYVARSEGGLDVFDAKTGAAVGRIGK